MILGTHLHVPHYAFFSMSEVIKCTGKGLGCVLKWWLVHECALTAPLKVVFLHERIMHSVKRGRLKPFFCVRF